VEHRIVASRPSFTVGVEEEYLIVDPESRDLRSRAESILRPARTALGDRVQPELSQSQIEVETPICRTLDEVRTELGRLRRDVTAAAEQVGSRLAASGTHPFADWRHQAITPKQRYLELDRDFRLLAREQLISGCHVHVGVDDPEEAIGAMDRCRPWLPTLLALSANSPFWQGVDSGYSSYRTQVFDRWPVTGTPPVLGSRAEYDRVVEDLVATGSMVDATKLYWDVRPSARFPTLEFRICDVCLTVEEAVLVAALTRSLVRTCHAAALRGEPVPAVRQEVVRAARWRAARDGLDDGLVDLIAGRVRPAAEVVGELVAFLRADLEDAGEWGEVSALASETVQRGTGARRQRDVFERSGSLVELVDWVVAQTRPPRAVPSGPDEAVVGGYETS
jgi:glutamate---cysteine ligase / carboxylate-amine ligase